MMYQAFKKGTETETVSRLLLLRMAGMETAGLKLEKIGPMFSSFDAMSSKITVTIIMVSSP